MLPILLISLGAVGILIRYPLVNLGAVLIGFAFAVNPDTGLQVSEILYGLYLYGYLLLWYALRFLRGDQMVFSTTDRGAAVFIVGGSLMGMALGLFFGAELNALRGDITGFLVLALYFPVKEACRREALGPEVIIGALLGLGLFLGVQNFLIFRYIISSATHLWEVVDARFAATEALIMVGAFGALFLLLNAERWRARLGLGVLLLFMLAALVLTKGRTFWVAFIFGTLLSLLFLRGRQRIRLVLLTAGGTALLLIVTTVFFGPLADLIFSVTLSRLGTLEGAASKDISLIGRFVEWKTLWGRIMQNPILGYGFGSTYKFYNIIERGTAIRDFSHNGYLAAWFKLGFFGLIAMLFFGTRVLYDSFQVHRNEFLTTRHRAYALISLVSVTALALAANASIFFIYMNQLFPFTLLAGLASGLRQGSDAGVWARRKASAPPPTRPAL